MSNTSADSLPVTLVDGPRTLDTMLADLTTADLTAADVEFSNDTTRILLMQFATADAVYLADPLALPDLTPILDWLANPDHNKVFHSGHDDARLVARQHGVDTRGVVDTQVLAAFCGYRYPVGLAALLESMEGIAVSKGQQRSDWGTRPLSRAQVRYAAADVRYLRDMVRRMEEQLDGSPQRQWAREESARVVEERNGFSAEETPDWRFADDWRQSDDETLCAFRLLDWSRDLRLPRIKGKKRKVRPRDLERIMRRIRDGAELTPGARDLPDWLTTEHVAQIDDLRGRTATPDETARIRRLPPPGPSGEERGRRVAAIMKHIEERCGEAGIAVPLVASKTAVEDFVRFGDAAESVLTTGWRADLLGPLP